MLRSHVVIVGFAIVGCSGAAIGCGNAAQGPTSSTGVGAGSGSSVASGTTTVSTGAGGAAATHAQPPAPGPMKPGDGAGSVTFAISKLYLGDTDPDGTPDRTNGWKQYGYDLDGKISTATSTDLCKPALSASAKNVYPDGNNGIDNSFGKLILPIVLGISADASSKVNAAFASGSSTVMFDMQKLGAGADYNPLVTNLFNGGQLGAVPKFDGTDAWPVLSDLLNDGTTIASGSKVSFPKSYVTSNIWVSGGKGSVDLRLPLFGGTLNLTIANAVVTLHLDPGHTHGTAGIIAGVLSTAQFTAEMKRLAGTFDSQLCSGPTIDSIVTQLTQASDIMKDGTQDPTRTCDGISIGLGFDAEVVQLGAVATPPATPDPCNTGSSSSSGGG